MNTSHLFKGIVFSVISLLFTTTAYGQFYDDYPYPQELFASPLGIDWKLSGTYGEPRGSHFHMGDDIKTNGATGYKLYAIGDGYISRIKVSPYGYGKAVYIDHYEGYTSVYGHMSRFNDRLDSLVKSYQYASQEFAQDITLPRDQLKIIQGEVIGLSGNSGGSGGPHLHFEIRESGTQKPINPLFFGYAVLDTKKPNLMGVKLSSIQNSYYDNRSEKYWPIAEVLDTISVPFGTRSGIAVHTLDQHDQGNNQNGVFRIEMLVDNESHFKFSMDKMSFDEGRYVNAFQDFYEKKQNKTVYNCYRLPGNQLKIYEHLVEDGFVDLKQGESKNITINVWDFHENKSSVSFVLEGVELPQKENKQVIVGEESKTEILHVVHNENYSFTTDDFKVYIPAMTFYDDITLKYLRKETKDANIYSDEYQLHDYLVPMHKSAVVQVRSKNLSAELHSKVVMMHRDLQGIEQSFTTFWKDDMVSAKTREVGFFYVKVDQVEPEIQWLNFTEKNQNFRGDQIRVKISDDLSGITDYNGYIDNKWVVFDYDAKRNLLTYDFDEHCLPGEHQLKVVVSDKVKNTAVKEIKFNLQ